MDLQNCQVRMNNLGAIEMLRAILKKGGGFYEVFLPF